MKKVVLALIIPLSVLLFCITAFAGSWQQNEKGYWWQNDDGSWPAGRWEWCDGNGDGVAECYYFDENGYCLMNTITPDGYQVNESGAWIVNGQIQSRQIGAATISESNTGSAADSKNTGKLSEYIGRWGNFSGKAGIVFELVNDDTLMIQYESHSGAGAYYEYLCAAGQMNGGRLLYAGGVSISSETNFDTDQTSYILNYTDGAGSFRIVDASAATDDQKSLGYYRYDDESKYLIWDNYGSLNGEANTDTGRKVLAHWKSIFGDISH